MVRTVYEITFSTKYTMYNISTDKIKFELCNYIKYMKLYLKINETHFNVIF